MKHLAICCFLLIGASIPGQAIAEEGRQEQRGEVVLQPLSYTVRASGPAAGAHPRRSDTVAVNYAIRLLDGTLIDASSLRGSPDSFELNRLVPAWQILVPLMRPGDAWTFYVPPEFGYGAVARQGIPANSFLVFEVELISSTPAVPSGN